MKRQDGHYCAPPKPAAGEWTVAEHKSGTVTLYCGDKHKALQCEGGLAANLKWIANNANASIAAERGKVAKAFQNGVDSMRTGVAEGEGTEQQLAAEQGPVYASQIAWEGDNLLADKDKQLAAERVKVEDELLIMKSNRDRWRNEVEYLRAAVEALKGYEYDSNGHITIWLSEAEHRAALAKIGEGK